MAERSRATTRRVVRGVALAAGAGLGALLLAAWRRDIPYDVLQARYGDAASRFVRMPGGVRLHYRDVGAPDAPALVLLHGFVASGSDWEPWVDRLAADHRVIVPDLPGHGLTAAPPGYRATIPRSADLVAALADALRLPPFVLVGHSMGGLVACRFALAHGSAVRGLVLVGSIGGSGAPPRGPRPLAFRLMGSAPGRFALRHLDPTPLVRRASRTTFADPRLATPAAVRRTVDLLRAPGHRAVLTTLDAGTGDPALLGRLAALAIPTLVMAGEADRMVPVADARRFADAVPRAALVTYPDVGHIPMIEAPERSAADLRAWLAALATGPLPRA